MSAAFVVTEGTVVMDEPNTLKLYVAQLPDGPIRVLDGSAREIWLAATQAAPSGQAPGWETDLAARFDVPLADIRADIERFVDELVGVGLLRPGSTD